MDSILASYTDGVLNIDRADAGRNGKSERGRDCTLFSFVFIQLLSIIQFCGVETSAAALWQMSKMSTVQPVRILRVKHVAILFYFTTQ